MIQLPLPYQSSALPIELHEYIAALVNYDITAPALTERCSSSELQGNIMPGMKLRSNFYKHTTPNKVILWTSTTLLQPPDIGFRQRFILLWWGRWDSNPHCFLSNRFTVCVLQPICIPPQIIVFLGSDTFTRPTTSTCGDFHFFLSYFYMLLFVNGN